MLQVNCLAVSVLQILSYQDNMAWPANAGRKNSVILTLYTPFLRQSLAPSHVPSHFVRAIARTL